MNAISTNNQSVQQQQINGDAHQTACESSQTYYAQPYSLDASGFYFSNFDDYTTKVEALRDCNGNQVEEFEIQFIDGSHAESDLFQAANVNQCNLGQFLAIVDEVSDFSLPAIFYLLDQGRTIEDAFNNFDEVCLFSGCLEDAAEELFDEIYAHEIPENLRIYIDYCAFARDCQYGGDMVEFEFGGETYTCTNASGL
ncbi:antirestriction protein ArdA [Gallionella capsiferriformans]|uniref:Antirestriction ArdA family protein n=1 Tax=Gallionella capsiferriformans (strain ES-2) TaxID=395494 RepID=D9SG91_GALCS|nr:antirestriction protein ArdA [Gallionella capsiferriformans]ADL55538.1 Antirestriction ArdA family protein [Gallionella capsiferriformans ES-2]